MDLEEKTSLMKALVAQGDKEMAKALIAAIEEERKKPKAPKAPSPLMLALQQRKHSRNLATESDTDDACSEQGG